MEAAKILPSSGKAQEVTLLTLESSPMMLYGEGITTVQFYDGSLDKAVVVLKERLAAVAKLNGWIGSSLIRQQDKVAMRYDAEAFPMDEVLQVNMDLTLHEGMAYNDMMKKGSSAGVPSGNTLLKNGKPVTKLTICPRSNGKDGANSSSGGFAVVLSMSHTVADGYTYYAILNMLASGVEPYAMVVTRDDSLRDSYPEQVGKGEYDRMLNPDLCTICKYIGAAMTAKSNPPLVRLVDKAKLAEMKESARSEDSAAAFVSTNDIITAGFARAVNAREITMAMDFRGRVEGLTKEHAGCYHFGLVYDAATCASPNLIRKALDGPTPLSRGAVPRCCGGGNSFAVISNWSSMSSKNGLSIEGCALLLHMPFSVIEPIDTCVVFTAKPGEVAVMMFLQHGTPESVLRELPCLGEPITLG